MAQGSKGAIYDGIERGNIRLRPSEVPYYESIVEYIREHPGCTRQEVHESVGTHSATSIILAIAIQSGRVRASDDKPQRLEVVE